MHTLALALLAAAVGVGVAAPPQDFTYADLDGRTHALSELRGSVVVLDFWAPWCAPCRKSFPFLDSLEARHSAAGLKVLGVALEESHDAVRAFVSEVPATFLVGIDPSGRAGELFEVAAMPTTVLLDREGRVLARFEGGTEASHLAIEQEVERALRGEPAASALAGARGGKAGSLRPWQRGFLADPILSLDGDVLTRTMRDHIYSSKEAAAGDGGVAGGGCGCN